MNEWQTNWLWALRDKEKAMEMMRLSSTKPEKMTSLPTVANNQKTSRQSTSTITKEPKLKTSDHRAFLEGFYEVDGAKTDWEREERMAQVDESLKRIEERDRKAMREKSIGTIPRTGQSSGSQRISPLQTGIYTRLPGNPNAPTQITNLSYRPSENRYSGYTNYVNAANTNTATTTSGNTTRPPTKEEMQAAYADMQNKFSGQNAWKHMEDVVEFVTNAATLQNNTQGKTQTATTTNTSQTQSRDERDANVRNNYRARQQAEADARYENFDIEAAEKKLRDDGYWIDRLFESRRQGNGFSEDEKVAEQRRALEEEIRRAKEAAERRRERYIREKAAQIPESKPGDMLRWTVGNMPEANQNTFSVNPQFSNTLYPETQAGYYDGQSLKKHYYTGEKPIYGEHTDEALDAISNILTAASLVPGIDTFADAAAIPVDLLRGDYISAGLDLLGIIPFVGEVADTAKLARAGIKVADKAHDAGKVIDAVKVADKADDVADAVKVGEDVYSARKVDGTIKAFLDASDDPIAELTKMSGSIAKTSPIKIPEGATIKPKAANKGYYHMEYKWTTDDGYEYITRWHTRNPTAPLEQRDVWIIERKIKGIGAGKNHRNGLHQVRVGRNEWITYAEWRAATFANQNGFATELQKEWLKNGHWKA